MKLSHGIAFLLITAWSQPLFGGNASWCLKVVDDTESPVANVQVFWRDADYPDWRPVQGLMALGNGRDGGGFQTIGETVSNLDNNDRVPGEFLRLLLNYLFQTPARGAHGYLKIAHPEYLPVEMQVPFPNDYKWERVELRRRDEGRGHGQRGSREQDRMPDAVLAITVLAENDQRTPQDDRPLPSATITVTIEASGRQYAGTTDGNGMVTLPVSEPGRATVEISCPGYRPKLWRTNLEAGRTEQQRIALLTERQDKR
jgi:hypothetical protein